MKLLFILTTLLCSTTTFAQKYIREGVTFKIVTPQRDSIVTKFVWVDSAGNNYTIVLTPSGRAFVRRISKKTGKYYRQYLPEQVSREVCRELNIKFEEKQ